MENSFGLLTRIFHGVYQPINPDSYNNLILVDCCPHNMLRDGYLRLKW